MVELERALLPSPPLALQNSSSDYNPFPNPPFDSLLFANVHLLLLPPPSFFPSLSRAFLDRFPLLLTMRPFARRSLLFPPSLARHASTILPRSGASAAARSARALKEAAIMASGEGTQADAPIVKGDNEAALPVFKFHGSWGVPKTAVSLTFSLLLLPLLLLFFGSKERGLARRARWAWRSEGRDGGSGERDKVVFSRSRATWEWPLGEERWSDERGRRERRKGRRNVDVRSPCLPFSTSRPSPASLSSSFDFYTSRIVARHTLPSQLAHP